MASIGHLAVGLAAGRMSAPRPTRAWPWTVALVALSYLPDADVLAFAFRIPYAAEWGHRGALHSLAIAVVCGVAASLAARIWRLSRLQAGATAGLVVASHGLLDTLTDGGLGVALLWPFDHQRYFAPWRPLPVAPIGPRILSGPGIALMAHEALLFLPLFLIGLWPRKRERHA
jgi:inner membrane protein